MCYFQLILQSGYDKKNMKSLILAGCCNITASALEEVLQLFPCISYVDIRGCYQLKDLKTKFQHVKWIKSSGSSSKIRSLKQITEQSYSTYMGDFDETDQSYRRDPSNLPFRQGFYKRSKLLNARKSSAVLSRDAQMRRWLQRKSGNGYKKMEEFIANSLKDIMRGNRFDFFIPKV